jgi:hypothetical protein
LTLSAVSSRLFTKTLHAQPLSLPPIFFFQPPFSLIFPARTGLQSLSQPWWPASTPCSLKFGSRRFLARLQGTHAAFVSLTGGRASGVLPAWPDVYRSASRRCVYSLVARARTGRTLIFSIAGPLPHHVLTARCAARIPAPHSGGHACPCPWYQPVERLSAPVLRHGWLGPCSRVPGRSPLQVCHLSVRRLLLISLPGRLCHDAGALVDPACRLLDSSGRPRQSRCLLLRRRQATSLHQLHGQARPSSCCPCRNVPRCVRLLLRRLTHTSGARRCRVLVSIMSCATRSCVVCCVLRVLTISKFQRSLSSAARNHATTTPSTVYVFAPKIRKD